ncbi:hypothetical protein [Actinomycetospora sp. NBRC 106378]|uniref:hypothetical protein n=1 Tax=Actinomycetospora sp. NBRC 106378 TaxID=3032208 RepID=UPI0024A061A9|nr:hypothetical protein [Actinomycetospora sp. NBRC 106378]GLZ50650.1 hypothetical protein Acsp07_02670 [Actinomycetospora sp. NBRC 106378]
MSMLRKVVVSTAIVGAGLGSLAGIASAHESGHAAAQGCSNTIKGASENGAGRTLGDTTGGDQDFSASNLCDIANGNKILSGNNVATLGSSIINGDTTTRTSNTSSTTSITDILTGLLPV